MPADADGRAIQIGDHLAPIAGHDPGLPLSVRVEGLEKGRHAIRCIIVAARPNGHPVGLEFVVCRPHLWRVTEEK